jgi:excisionase family DNA binding protein
MVPDLHKETLLMKSTDIAQSSAIAMTGYLPDDLLKPEEAAAYLRLSKSTLAKMRLSGTGPRYQKFGRAVRYRRRDLDAWARLAGRTARPTRTIACPGGLLMPQARHSAELRIEVDA